MAQTKEIIGQIGSIKNTQKITSAMEMVAASKMKSAQELMALSKPYAQKIRSVIAHVSQCHSEYRHVFLQRRESIKRVGYIVISSDRGLCGGLNINSFKHALNDMQRWKSQEVGIDLCLVGHKAELFFSKFGGNVLASVSHLGDKPSAGQLVGVVKVMLDAYANGECDAVYLVSNDFVNTMVQKPVRRQLLPLEVSTLADEGAVQAEAGYWDYIYEPDFAAEIMEKLLKRYIESQVYQAVVENIACFQASQMMAMRSATDNAGEIIDELELVYNKARQAGITQEIAEVVGGAAAVE